MEILEQAEEDGDESVTVDVVDLALLEKDVGFVEEEHGAPGVSNVEDLLKLIFQLGRIGAQLTRRDHIERAFQKLRDALGGHGLPCARGSVQY